MGGGGKTTLARAVYDQISNHFEGKSFVENVREVSKPSLCGLKKLQKRILKDVLNKQDITFSSVHDGKNMLKDMMSRKKTLVVLDDVDCIEQLEALAGEPNWFKLGSRIIITTRDEQVLLAHQVNFFHDINLLSSTEAICLLSRYAFKREIPTRGYEELSEQVLRYASGLPLTIKVLGSLLCGKNEREWENTIQRLKIIPLQKTMQILELSYNGLEEEYKQIFLDVACILKGWEKEDAIRALESRGFHAEVGLKVLEQKSIITISEWVRDYEELGMHDHLQEMGRNIVRQSNEPQRHSRLWDNEEIEDILKNDLGTQETKCLYFCSPGFSAEIAVKGLAKMKDLRFIHINLFKDYSNSNIVQFDKVSEYLPSSLQFMRWWGFPFSSLPNTFQGKYLVELDIRCSNIVQLWEDGEEKVLPKLKFLTIIRSDLQTFDLILAPNLEQLTIHNCGDFVELHMPAESPKLKEVNISHSKLKTLYLGSTPNLETLVLEGCNDLVVLQMPAESPKLEKVKISHSKLKTLCLGSTPNLKRLTLEKSDDLVELQMPAESPKFEKVKISHSKLKTLHLGSTPNLKRLTLEKSDDLVELEMPAESPKLENVNISHSKLKTLHLGNTPNLKILALEGCKDLVELQMPVERLKLEWICFIDTKLKTLDLGLTPNLEWLKLENCYDLVEINAPIGCGRFKSFEFDKCSESEHVGLPELRLIAEPTDVCPLHSDNDSPKFRFKCYYEEDPASSFGNLERLISIGLCACINLESFSRSICSLQCLRKLKLKGSISKAPKDLDRLECLEELTFSSTEIKNLPDSICMLKHLKSLKLKSCLLLEKLPDDLGRLESLETLILTDCKLLQYIPNSICKMKCINNLRLRGCIRVVELPEDIGCLEGLKELNIEGTGISHLPQSIFQLRGLRIVGSMRLIDTYGLLLKRRRTCDDDDEIVCYI